MQTAFRFELKSVAAEEGTFEGLASTYGGDPDLQNDIVNIGAFTKTLAASKERPLLWQHRDPIGMVQLSDSPAGLIAKGKLSLGIQQAKDALVLLSDGVVKGLSIGYETIKSDFKGDIRHIFEAKLWEVSLVTFPANSNALVSGVKSIDHTRIQTSLKSFRDDILRELKGKQ